MQNSTFYLVSVAEQTGSSLTLPKNPKTCFLTSFETLVYPVNIQVAFRWWADGGPTLHAGCVRAFQ